MKLKANAKINLTLDICSKREDGYHIIDSIMQSVSLSDTVTIEKSDKLSVLCDGISEEQNIAYLAAKAFFEYTKISGGAGISIEKSIPVSAGLGGGSTDAAAVINGLDMLYGTDLSEKERCEIGLKVGADVPFCIAGGTIRVGGIGEELEKIPDIPECHFVIVKEGLKGSTGQMYKQLDQSSYFRPDTSSAVKAIEKGSLNELIGNIGNSFASVCDYSKAQSLLEPFSPLCIALSGSGPSVFAVFDERDKALNAAESLKGIGINAFYAAPEKSGTVLV